MNNLFCCNICVNNNISKEIKITENTNNKKVIITKSGDIIPSTPKVEEITIGFINNGFVGFYKDNQSCVCPICNSMLSSLSLTVEEWEVLKQVSVESSFILAMDKLKQDDIIEFNVKLSQFKSQSTQQNTTSQSQSTPNIPKCPTCGSTNIKKISGAKRWVGTGLFGLASSDLGKTMQCNNCGAKW